MRALAIACTAACLVLLWAGGSQADAESAARQDTLLAWQAASKDGIITFSSEDWEEFAMVKDRPYHLVVFCAAASLMSSPKTQLNNLRAEYSLAAQAFARGPEDQQGKIFFIELWYEKSTPLFSRMGIQSVPFAFLWTPSSGAAKSSGSIKIPEDNRLGKGFAKYPWPAEEIVTWLKDKTRIKPGDVDRPSFLKSPLFPVTLLFSLVCSCFAGWRLYNTPLVQNKTIWALGSLVVFWFSVSGGMYNIIRGIPMYTIGQNGKIVWRMSGRQGQLGLEGFFMGSMYMVFSLCVCGLIYGAPRVKNEGGRMVVSMATLAVSGLTLWQIITQWQAKTGFAPRSFFF